MARKTTSIGSGTRTRRSFRLAHDFLGSYTDREGGIPHLLRGRAAGDISSYSGMPYRQARRIIAALTEEQDD